MDSYKKLQQKIGERLHKLTSLKVAATSIIRRTVDECIDTHGFPTDAFTFLAPDEPHSLGKSVTRDKLGDTVRQKENGDWGCKIFVRIELAGRGEITTHLEPEISFGTEQATLRLIDYPEAHCFYEEKNKEAGIRAYADAWIRELDSILNDFDANEGGRIITGFNPE